MNKPVRENIMAKKKLTQAELLNRAADRAKRMESAIKALNEDCFELMGWGMDDKSLKLVRAALNKMLLGQASQ